MTAGPVTAERSPHGSVGSISRSPRTSRDGKISRTWRPILPPGHVRAGADPALHEAGPALHERRRRTGRRQQQRCRITPGFSLSQSPRVPRCHITAVWGSCRRIAPSIAQKLGHSATMSHHSGLGFLPEKHTHVRAGAGGSGVSSPLQTRADRATDRSGHGCRPATRHKVAVGPATAPDPITWTTVCGWKFALSSGGRAPKTGDAKCRKCWPA